MGIERARVVEVHAPGSSTGAGYLISDRLVLTTARTGPAEVRPTTMGQWLPARAVWSGGRVTVLALEAPLCVSPIPIRWGAVEGPRPVPVMAMGFPPADDRPQWVRDPVQFVGQLTSGGVVSGAPVGGGMWGAALFAGAELVGVLASGPTVPVARLAEDRAFVDVVGELALTPVRAPSTRFPIL